MSNTLGASALLVGLILLSGCSLILILMVSPTDPDRPGRGGGVLPCSRDPGVVRATGSGEVRATGWPPALLS